MGESQLTESIFGMADKIRSLEEAVVSYLPYLRQAIERKALYPNIETAQNVLSMLTTLEGLILNGIGSFTETPLIEEYRANLDIINKNMPHALNYARLFEGIHAAVSQHIELEVLPNPVFDGERIYLKQGILIMPTMIKSYGYHIFKFSATEAPARGGMQFWGVCLNFNLDRRISNLQLAPGWLNPLTEAPSNGEKQLTFGEKQLTFKLLTQYGLPSIDEAVSKYAGPNMFGTVAVARNTEHYPLQETSLPIAMQKYRHGLMGQK